MFLPTAYCGGFLLNFVNRQLAEFRFVEAGDADRYLGLVADYAQLIEQFAVRTAGQRSAACAYRRSRFSRRAL